MSKIETILGQEPQELSYTEISDVHDALLFLATTAYDNEQRYFEVVSNLSVEVVDLASDPDFTFDADIYRNAYNILRGDPKKLSNQKYIDALEQSGVNDLLSSEPQPRTSDNIINTLGEYLRSTEPNNTQPAQSDFEQQLLANMSDFLIKHKLLPTDSTTVATRARILYERGGNSFRLRINVFWFGGSNNEVKQEKLWMTEYDIKVNRSAHPDLFDESIQANVVTRDPTTSFSNHEYRELDARCIDYNRSGSVTTLEKQITMLMGTLILYRAGDEVIEQAKAQL